MHAVHFLSGKIQMSKQKREPEPSKSNAVCLSIIFYSSLELNKYSLFSKFGDFEIILWKKDA